MQLKIRLSEEIQTILDLYDTVRELLEKGQSDLNNTIFMVNIKPRLFSLENLGINLGILNKPAYINLPPLNYEMFPIFVPNGAVDEATHRKYAQIYFICWEYIRSNSSRVFGRANLDDLDHGKVLAFLLIAHMALSLVKSAIQEEREQYEARITKFVTALFQNKNTQKTTSNDMTYLSASTALENIYACMTANEPKGANAIKELKDSTQILLANLWETVSSTTDALINWFSKFETSSKVLAQYRENKVITGELQTILDDKLLSLISPPKVDVGEYNNQLAIDIVPKGTSYVFDKFLPTAKSNFFDILQIKNKITIIFNNLKIAHELYGDNIESLFNYCDELKFHLHLLPSLTAELAQRMRFLELDCGKVFQDNKHQRRWLATPFSDWESRYRRKEYTEEAQNALQETERSIIKSNYAIVRNYSMDLINDLSQKKKTSDDLNTARKIITGNEGMYSNEEKYKPSSKALRSEMRRQLNNFEERIIQMRDELKKKIKFIYDNSTFFPDFKLLRSLEKHQTSLEFMLQKNDNDNEKTIYDEWVFMEDPEMSRKLDDTQRLIVQSSFQINLKKEEQEKSKQAKKYKQVKQSFKTAEAENGDIKYIAAIKNEMNSTFKGLGITNHKLVLAILKTAEPVPEEGNYFTEYRENIEQLQKIFENIQTCMKRFRPYFRAYINNSHAHGSFMVHNHHGREHARKVKLRWEKNIKTELLGSNLNNFLKTGGNPRKSVTEVNEYLSEQFNYLLLSLDFSNNFSGNRPNSFKTYCTSYITETTRAGTMENELENEFSLQNYNIEPTLQITLNQPLSRDARDRNRREYTRFTAGR